MRNVCLCCIFVTLTPPLQAASLIGVRADGSLWNVPLGAGSESLLVRHEPSQNFGGLEFSPTGRLYAVSGGSPGFQYELHPTTGAILDFKELTNAFFGEGCLVFDPNGTALVFQGGGNPARFFRVNVETGSVLSQQFFGNYEINGALWRSDGMMVGLDGLSNSLVTINPSTGATATLAPTPSPAGFLGGMTQINGVGYYVNRQTAAYSELWSFDPFTGQQTFIRNLDAAYMALAAVPEPSTLILAAVGLVGVMGVCRRNLR
jgi:hypothetical protein